MEDFLKIVLGCSFVLAIFAILFSVARFAIRDARKRGKSPLLVAIAAVCFFPWGLIAWLIFRPEPMPNPSQWVG